MTNSENLILVTAANGTTGRRVTDRLTCLGLPVRAGSRTGSPPFDWHDESSWAPVLNGVSAAYLAYHPDLVSPGAVEIVRRFCSVAVAGGVRRLVLLSGRGEPAAEEAERAVLDCGTEGAGVAGVDVTVVRSAFFAQNFSEKDFVELVRDGMVALPAGPVGEPFVDADDLADVVVAALTEDGHAGQIYETTGPRLLTFAEAIAEIARATGRDIQYLRITPEQFAEALTGEGLPADMVSALVEIFTTVLDGRNAHLADGVQRALGRTHRDFASFARAAAATGVWDAADTGAQRTGAEA